MKEEKSISMVPRWLRPFYVALLFTLGIVDLLEGRNWIGWFTLIVSILLAVVYASLEIERSKEDEKHKD